ncbi:hypothetical protein GCM10007962_01920 [Yeosuana aromativorans]|uniref:Uncharacterized protein n=1 Tax=Yeosuana aromativorans TaxID=288019 RepID=A0A8J3BIN2_9FLAO|nr:hypothetical protein [Yeosuana aromativorans]GGK11312.1 hypothetical protein GCM10007962_01920 [Yeosuana aromativorans]
MEPNKFEKHIKNTLEKRTIQPSKDAWNKLEDKLNASENHQKSNYFMWIGIAASIVGILLVVSQFFNDNQMDNIEPVIVNNPKIETQDEPTQIAVEKMDDNKQNKVSEKSDYKIKPAIITKTPVLKIHPKEQEPIALSEPVVSDKDIVPENPIINHVEIKQNKLSLEDEKIQDVIAQVQSLKDRNHTVTDNEIELLLQQAQKDIRQQQMYDENSGVVDAQLLLEDVETDLDQSFREKAFEALKANFNFIKTAVAKRND